VAPTIYRCSNCVASIVQCGETEWTLMVTKSSKCKACQSRTQREFNGEIAIHFPGLEGLDKPIVWVFPQLLVCLGCGFTEFSIPESELQLLAKGLAASG